jgi:Fe-S-cluster-containing dehydrogenase component
MSRAFLLDLNACTGCGACRLACTLENGLPWGTSWRQIFTFNEGRHPAAPSFHLSMACNHCAQAPCIEQCPALAIRREGAGGEVLLDPGRCIGCGCCGWACPYDAPLYDEEAGVMGKCTFCSPRLAEGREPACVSLCPTGALRSGEIEEIGGVERAEGFPPRPARPSLRFLPLREGRSEPETGLHSASAPDSLPPAAEPPPPGAGLATEWPLAVFTLAAAALVSWLTASLGGAVPMHAPTFLASAALALGVSALHLGRKERAWRALLNLRRSWLSREIALFSLFVGLAAIHLLLAPRSVALAHAASAVGFAALFAIDRVYDLAISRRPVPLHSADVLLTGLLLTGYLLADLWLAGPAALLALALYVQRRTRGAGEGGRAQERRTVIRLGAGFLLPALLWIARPPLWWECGLLALAVGVIVDRCELYLEIDLPSPRRELAAALERRLRSAPASAGTSSATSSPSW